MRRKSWTTLAAALAASLALCAPALAADGDADTTFDGDGIAHLPFGDSAEVALQPDGKVIAVGNVPGGDSSAYVARLTPTGSLDPSFSGDGVAHLDAPGGISLRDVAVQPDGKVVAAGIVRPLEDGAGIVFRLTGDGDLDPTFDGDGSATFAFGPGFTTIRAMALQPDGRIVVAGGLSTPGASDFGAARLNADGTLDSGFAGDGTKTEEVGGNEESARVLILQGNRIVLAGMSGSPGGYQLAAVRLLSDGSRDAAFGSAGGQARSSTVNPTDGVVTPDGGLAFAGTVPAAGDDFAVLKLDASGRPDTGFSSDADFGDGVRRYDLAGSGDIPAGISVTSDGRYTLVGTTWPIPTNADSTPNLAALQITSTGELVPSFGDGGKRIYDSLGRFEARDLVQQPDGGLLVGGDDGEGMAVARISAGAPPPPPPPESQLPRIDLTGGTAVEGQVLVFTATLSEPSDRPVTVGFVTGEGTAATGLDFGGRRGTVTIPAGQLSAPIGIATNADFLYEPADEMFRVELFDPVNARFGEYVAFGTIVNDLRSGRCRNVVVGRKGTDVLTGSSAGDLIVGRQDIDFLFGLGGPDCIRGERGDDIIDGGDGDDLVDGGSGDDRLRGGDGDDRLYGRRGINRYNGGPGNDRIYSRNGRSEIVECGPGRDAVKADRRDRLRRCERATR